jgi:hypothetical protein
MKNLIIKNWYKLELELFLFYQNLSETTKEKIITVLYILMITSGIALGGYFDQLTLLGK